MKKSKTPKLVTLAILTAIVTAFWVFFSVYRVFTNEPPLNVPAEILEPISPTLDSDVIDKIQGRIFFSEGEIGITQIQSPTATGSETPSP
ncbi:MAG: hypothetical protein AAB875_05755 [Patescibacteria group bacterium]